MGGKLSKPFRRGKKDKKAGRGVGGLAIGAPQDVQIQIPRNQLDAHGQPIQQVTRDVDHDTLLAALQHVSDYVAGRGTHVEVVAVGGAVNLLLLRSRATTHDVDVFGADFDNAQRALLNDAMQSAQQALPGLGTDWLNTDAQLWLSGPLHQQVTAASKAQGVVVFRGAGLTIYAALWEYAFSAKISRLVGGSDQVRPYDLADAVAYLHQYILRHGNRPVPIATVLGWARQYRHKTSEAYLRDRIDAEYQRQHGGRHGIE